MLRIQSFLSITVAISGCFIHSALALAGDQGENSKQIKKYQEIFQQQNLPYLRPKGCSKTTPCCLAADFNGDGVIDFAGLYEYSGPKHRSEDTYLDLVFIYSTSGSSDTEQEIFSYVGKINSAGEPQVELKIQDVGSMQLPVGKIELKHPGVNVLTKGKPQSVYTPTFYWNGKNFYSISKADD